MRRTTGLARLLPRPQICCTALATSENTRPAVHSPLSACWSVEWGHWYAWWGIRLRRNSTTVQHCLACPERLPYNTQRLGIKRASQSQDGMHSLFFDSYMVACCSRQSDRAERCICQLAYRQAPNWRHMRRRHFCKQTHQVTPARSSLLGITLLAQAAMLLVVIVTVCKSPAPCATTSRPTASALRLTVLQLHDTLHAISRPQLPSSTVPTTRHILCCQPLGRPAAAAALQLL